VKTVATLAIVKGDVNGHVRVELLWHVKRFHKPISVGAKLIVKGWVVKRRRRLFAALAGGAACGQVVGRGRNPGQQPGDDGKGCEIRGAYLEQQSRHRKRVNAKDAARPTASPVNAIAAA
jgi:hypothetical protein